MHPSPAERGIGKVELVLMVLLCAAVAVLALTGRSGLPHARIENNEAAALRALVAIAAAQETWKAEAKVDQDLDTVGEYGLLGELAGGIVPRTQQGRVAPAFIAEAFDTGGREGADGCAVVGGYVFRIYLVGAVEEDGAIAAGDDRTLGGTASSAGETLTAVEPIDEFQEKGYVLYAWPLKAGATGRRAFVITQAPLVFETDMGATAYSGRGPIGAPNVPAPDAAFAEAAFRLDPATGDGLPPYLFEDAHAGRDGNTWRPAGPARRNGPRP